MVQFLGSEAGTALLLVLLVVAFVVAFKVLKMVFETVTIAAMSAGFYLALVYLYGFPLKLDRVLLFAFLGASFYMGYSLLASVWVAGTAIMSIPLKLVGAAVYPFRKILEYLRKKEKLRKLRESEEKKAQDVKEVVLNKVGDD